MFWDSLFTGLKVLSYWETYVAGLMYLVIAFSPILLFSDRSAGGCLAMLLVSILKVFGLCVVVLTLSPILLGLSSDAAWSFPWLLLFQEPVFMLKLVGSLIILAFVLPIIPVVGDSPGLYELVAGAIVLAVVASNIDRHNPDLHIRAIQIVPDFWFGVKVLISSAVILYLGLGIVGGLLGGFTGQTKISEVIWIPVFASVFGLLPVFIYGGWLALQIKAQLLNSP